MSRTLALQKLKASIDAMGCAQSNMIAAADLLNDAFAASGDEAMILGASALSLLTLSVGEFIKGAREAEEAIAQGSLRAD